MQHFFNNNKSTEGFDFLSIFSVVFLYFCIQIILKVISDDYFFFRVNIRFIFTVNIVNAPCICIPNKLDELATS